MKKKVWLFIIVLILLVSMFAGGLFVGKEFINNDSKCNKDTSEKQDLNNKEVQKETEELFSKLNLNIEHLPEYISLFYNKVGIGDFITEVNIHGLDFMYLMYYQDHIQELKTIQKFDREVKEIPIADFRAKYGEVFGEYALTSLTEEKFNNNQIITVYNGDEANDSGKLNSCFLRDTEDCSLTVDSAVLDPRDVKISYLKKYYISGTDTNTIECKAVIKDGEYKKELSFDIDYTVGENSIVLNSIIINSLSDSYSYK